MLVRQNQSLSLVRLPALNAELVQGSSRDLVLHKRRIKIGKDKTELEQSGQSLKVVDFISQGAFMPNLFSSVQMSHGAFSPSLLG